MKSGYHYHFRKLEFWAERGLINIVDERYPPKDPRSFLVITVRQFLQNVQGMNQAISYVPGKYADEREEMHRFVDNALRCCREAKNQGRPDDPKAMADMLKARRKHWSCGTNSGTVLHTESADVAPEGAMLPPLDIPGVVVPHRKIIVSGG